MAARPASHPLDRRRAPGPGDAAGDEIDAKGRASRAGEDQARRLDEVIRALRALPWGSVIAVLIVAGCAALAPARATDPKLQPWQDFADATAKAYGKWYAPRVEYALPNSPYEGARWSLGTIYVRGELLDQLNMPLLFAHELGHYVLEHRSSSPQVEMEANAQAVEILVRVRRVDELQALTAFHGYLLSVHRSQASRGVLPGHASACQEIADLVRRYPKHETVTRTWECAK